MLATTVVGALIFVGSFALLMERELSVEVRFDGICTMLFGLFLVVFPSALANAVKWSELE